MRGASFLPLKKGLGVDDCLLAPCWTAADPSSRGSRTTTPCPSFKGGENATGKQEAGR